MKIKKIVLFLFLAVSVFTIFAQPPTPPKDYKWVVNEKFTDEFNGTELDKTKWYDRSPYWVNGRPPATFRAYSVSVKDGAMQIKNSVLEGDKKYNIAGGAVASVAKDGFYGYYECRLKASGISMSTTFWMKNKPEGPDCPFVQLELDIVELVGMQKRKNDFRNVMHSNTHTFHRACDGTRTVKSKGGTTAIVPPANEAYHTYGCWWEDANTLHFYLDGKLVYTVNPDTTFSKTPFNRPMYMHLVTETYDWEEPPTPEELNNDDINTSYYDWVRAYTLQKVE